MVQHQEKYSFMQKVIVAYYKGQFLLAHLISYAFSLDVHAGTIKRIKADCVTRNGSSPSNIKN